MDDKEFLEKIRDTFEKDKIKLADKKVITDKKILI